MKPSKRRRRAVIMGGGAGIRFWPISRADRPKQFLCLTGDTASLLEQAVNNISLVFPRENIFLITGKHLVNAAIHANTGLSNENIIAEPFRRNTSGCIALAAALLLSRYGDEGRNITLGVFTADHFIADPQRFRVLVEAALSAAESTDALITFGIKPDRPETGYGYLEITEEPELTIGGIPVYTVARFSEKPDPETIQKYLETGRHYWNSGMFFWRISTILDELNAVSAELSSAIETMAQTLKSGDHCRFEHIFRGLQDMPIDTVLMEKAHRVLALKADFGWDDIGAWNALDRINARDENGNVISGDPVVLDSRDCIVYHEPGSKKTAVGVIGVEGLAVIVSDDGVLVVPKKRAQEVRTVVSELKKKGLVH